MKYACLVVSTDFKTPSVLFEFIFYADCVNTQYRKSAVTAIGHNLLGIKRN